MLFLCKCWKMEYKMSKQLLDACASLGTEYNWVGKRAAENSWLISLSKLTNHNCKTCDPPPNTPSLCRHFLSSVYVWESFPHSKNIKIRSSENLWQARPKEKKNNWSDSASYCDQCTSEWHQIKKKKKRLCMKKTCSSILILILTVR